MGPWECLETRLTADYRIFRTRIDRLRSPRNGQVGDFVILEAPDWVNVVALTQDEQAVMVRQVRHGLRLPTLEIPGGMVDPGEEPLQAAARELLEETGYAAQRWETLGWVHPNPALMGNRCHSFLALGCTRVAEPHPEGTEDLLIELHPSDRLPELVQQGQITHSLVVGAFYWYFFHRARAGGGGPGREIL